MGTGGVAKLLDRVDGIAEVIRAGAAESERLGRLAPDVLAALHESGLFRILVPTEFGGAGLTIPESIEVLERVAALDASTGWTLTILSDGALFARFLAPEAFTSLCQGGGLLAGTLNPATARAESVDGGFVFSGRATYLSGSAHAQWIMATALVVKDGAPVFHDDGMIDIRSGVFPIDRARCLDTWHVTGMRATGSSDYAFEGVEVSSDWTFEPLRAGPGGADVFARTPLWAQLGSGLAANAVGAARNMIERFTELAADKVPTGGTGNRLADGAPAQIAVGQAQGLYQAARAVLMDTTRSVWAAGEAGETFDDPRMARIRVGSVTAVRLAAQAIDLLHDAAGMNAVAQDSILDRCWRDVHTMTQHVFLSPGRYEIAGRVLLGRDPGSPII